jgi:hypothetical protein
MPSSTVHGPFETPPQVPRLLFMRPGMNSLLPTCLDILGSISPIHSQKCAAKGRRNWNDAERDCPQSAQSAFPQRVQSH